MGRTAVLFPGQGAQFVGMGKDLADSFPPAQELFERADSVLGYRLSEICFSGPSEELDSTIVSQPAIFTVSLAMLEFLRQENPEALEQCEAAAGLSLGEYTALTFAGVFDFEDGLQLVQKRGQAMQIASDAAPSGMVSIIGMELSEVESLCGELRQGEVLQVANMLCPGNVVVSGTNAACERVAELSAKGKLRAVPLAVAGAFHTPLMKPADEILTRALNGTKINPPRIPVISNVDAAPHGEPENIKRTLVKQILSPVLWEQSMRTLLAGGFDTFYEVGPGRVLRSLMKRIDRKVKCCGVGE